MKVILNDSGIMKDKKFRKFVKGMSEIEWRTSPKIIKLIDKKTKGN